MTKSTTLEAIFAVRNAGGQESSTAGVVEASGFLRMNLRLYSVERGYAASAPFAVSGGR